MTDWERRNRTQALRRLAEERRGGEEARLREEAEQLRLYARPPRIRHLAQERGLEGRADVERLTPADLGEWSLQRHLDLIVTCELVAREVFALREATCGSAAACDGLADCSRIDDMGCASLQSHLQVLLKLRAIEEHKRVCVCDRDDPRCLSR